MNSRECSSCITLLAFSVNTEGKWRASPFLITVKFPREFPTLIFHILRADSKLRDEENRVNVKLNIYPSDFILSIVILHVNKSMNFSK